MVKVLSENSWCLNFHQNGGLCFYWISFLDNIMVKKANVHTRVWVELHNLASSKQVGPASWGKSGQECIICLVTNEAKNSIWSDINRVVGVWGVIILTCAAWLIDIGQNFISNFLCVLLYISSWTEKKKPRYTIVPCVKHNFREISTCVDIYVQFTI